MDESAAMMLWEDYRKAVLAYQHVRSRRFRDFATAQYLAYCQWSMGLVKRELLH